VSAEPLEAVLLDAFGTLLAMRPPARLLRAELAARGLELEEERAAQAFAAEIAYYLDHQLEGRDEESLDDLRRRCAVVLREALGNPPGLGIDDARDAMLAAIRFDAFPDAEPALRDLRERGLRVVVASNWDCSLPGFLRDAGLDGLVDEVATSAVAGARKPDPRLFETALELAGCGPGAAVHVGDSLADDVAGAAAAGIRPVLIARGGPPEALPDPAPAAVIERLTELPRVI
jgi:putative hydrolase of the HAD superfamily